MARPPAKRPAVDIDDDRTGNGPYVLALALLMVGFIGALQYFWKGCA